MANKTASKVRPHTRDRFENDPEFRKQAEADYGAKAKELGISVMELYQMRADRWTGGEEETRAWSELAKNNQAKKAAAKDKKKPKN